MSLRTAGAIRGILTLTQFRKSSTKPPSLDSGVTNKKGDVFVTHRLDFGYWFNTFVPLKIPRKASLIVKWGVISYRGWYKVSRQGVILP